MDPGITESLSSIVETAEPILRNIGEFGVGGVIGNALYSAADAAVTNRTFTENFQGRGIVAGVVGGTGTALGHPFDYDMADMILEYVGASVAGAGIGAVGGPLYDAQNSREPFYDNWVDKAQYSATKGMFAIPALWVGFETAEYISRL